MKEISKRLAFRLAITLPVTLFAQAIFAEGEHIRPRGDSGYR